MPHSPSSSTHSTQTPIDAARSVASSPTTTMTSAHSGQDDNNNDHANSLDDIFGSSPDTDGHFSPRNSINDNSAREESQPQSQSQSEPSDLPALRRQHVTAGYRDGIAASKAEHVQEGFDGGYPVGTQFGLRVGTILGILEGVIKGLQGRDAAGPVKKRAGPKKEIAEDKETEEEKLVRTERIDRIKKLYTTATKELDVEALFGGLTADEEGAQGQKPETRMKANAEPALAKWEKLVGVTTWEENMEAVESMEDADQKTA
ncbi:hypothetical protein PISL3812_00148 [Talaromyces islandicus]|uniref:Protein YAE1 n=1 Tax=Talaromyces islandicus TaxID=28573 RepID=A0A0U1LJ36_TALIS|nr:hypothetical protein PISL3812_00148 [Talaromyces islandicus]